VPIFIAALNVDFSSPSPDPLDLVACARGCQRGVPF